MSAGLDVAFQCACRFTKADEFAHAVQVEWCGRHAELRDTLAMLRQMIENTVAVARIDDDGECVTAYHFQTGAIHRLLSAARCDDFPEYVRDMVKAASNKK